jgi:flagellar hook protein FlgE
MFRSPYLSLSGIVNHQKRMDVIGNNIANSNTTAYKTGRADFKDALYQAADGSQQEKASNQMGTGVHLAGISSNFTQGPLQPTGRTLDLAISGPGFFGVKDESDKLKFTRDGTLFLDSEGYLVNSSGLKVVNTDEDEIQLDVNDFKSQEDLKISKSGEIYIDGNSTGEVIALFKFQNPWGLTKEGSNIFLENDNTGERISNEDESEGFGSIRSGFLEMSNIDLAQELTNLITTQRGHQANAKVFSTADEVLREIIELKR